MARRLIDGDRRREQQKQAAALDRLQRRFEPSIAREVARASRIMAQGFEETGAVPLVPDHRQRVAELLDGMAGVSVRVFAGRVLNAGFAKASPYTIDNGATIHWGRGALGSAFESKDFADTVARLAQRYIMLEAFRRRIVSIAETTRAQIIAQVERGFAAGLGQEGVARFIADNVASIARTRARVIARTETHSAANYGAFGAAEETGLTLEKEWISAEDERTREAHAAADGQIVGKDEMFDIGGFGAMYPGDPSLPADQSINCRCAIGWIVQD
jgi:hypothetical protein